MTIVNQKVRTPIGEGTVQGGYVAPLGDDAVKALIVRLPINDVTRSELVKSNCLTPHARSNGLWVFQERELR